MSKTVAIIPARGGSKGVPGKNLRKLGGRTLVGWAIHAARESGVVTDVVVTTDSDDIAGEAKAYGANVVARPESLSSDSAKTIDAVIHVFDTLGLNHGTCVLLQPTSPLRTAEDIRGAMHVFQDAGETGSVCSVSPCEHHPLKTLRVDDAGVTPMLDFNALETPRQELPQYVRVNGAIYINRIEDLLSRRTFFAQPVRVFRMSAERSIDIDSEIDLTVAAQFLQD